MADLKEQKNEIINALKQVRKNQTYSSSVYDITKFKVTDTIAKAFLIQIVVAVFDEAKDNYLENRDVTLMSWALLKEYSSVPKIMDRRAQYVFSTEFYGKDESDKIKLIENPDSEEYKIIRGKSNSLLKHENVLFGKIANYYLVNFISKDSVERFFKSAIRKWISKETNELLLPTHFSREVTTPKRTTHLNPVIPTDINTSPDTIKLISAESTEEYSAYNNCSDSDDGRQIYTTEEVNKGILADSVVFNSISDGKVGDESKFVGAKPSNSANDIWTNDIINVHDGEAYVICLYVHNDNPIGLGAIAENTRVTFSLPTTASTSHTIIGYLDSSNATPSRCWDTVTLRSDELFYLEYIDGSAKYTNNHMGTIGIGNDAITAGFPIGYDRFDGKIPGGDRYAGIVTIEVVIHKSVEAKLSLSARISGAKEWNRNKVDANIGDIVDFQIEFVNLLAKQVDNIMIRNILPTNTEYIDNSTVLYNSNHPDGVSLMDNTVVTSGINIGSYGAKGNAYIRFKTRIVDKTLADGRNQLVNWANVTVYDSDVPTVYKDDVSILVNKR